MTYFCFIESDILSTPHMEPLTAETLDDAAEEARRLMRNHASAIAAHVFEGDERISSIRLEFRPAAASSWCPAASRLHSLNPATWAIYRADIAT